MAMIEMTTSNSMRVKAWGRILFFVVEEVMRESCYKVSIAASLGLWDRLGDEVVGLGPEDFGVDECPDFGGLGEDNAAIDFGGVVFGAARVGGFHEDAEGLACAGFGHFAGDALLEFHGLAVATVFRAGGDLAIHLGRAGAILL